MKYPLHYHSPISLFLNFFHNQTTSAHLNPDFINSLIHELKTPLNAVSSFSEMLQKDIKNPLAAAECIDYTKEISRAVLDMNELIHDLLDVGSMRLGNFSVDLGQEIDVAEIIKRSVRLNYGYALKRRISIVSEVSENFQAIKLDAKRLKQILVNLISNSIKYSPENTEIKIEAKRDTTSSGDIMHPDVLAIIISDQGFGMTEEQVARAFEKYQTIENPNSGKVDSFGLGLPIVRRLVELQKGRIEMVSELNKGTKVILKFSY